MWRVPVGTQIPVEVMQVSGSKLEMSSYKHQQVILTGANPMQHIFSPATADRTCRIDAIYVQVVDDVPGGASDIVLSLYGSSSLGDWRWPVYYITFAYVANEWFYLAPGLDYGTIGTNMHTYPLFDYMFNDGDYLQFDTVQSVDDQILITILYREYWNKVI